MPVVTKLFNAKLFVFELRDTFELMLSPQLVKVASNTADNEQISKKDCTRFFVLKSNVAFNLSIV